ncbi:hypothetical protein LTR36_010284 [Oleoguttula mirabilis]|uniref:Potassium channel domain-containing protein n=1 Tax=Oleoguttula mirabilis TaxID=1507867 RepID=A0AAV9J4N5_9PEZI|nr:hypothetical protein LTR36_010284 [Oleoguttula mirabilis]
MSAIDPGVEDTVKERSTGRGSESKHGDGRTHDIEADAYDRDDEREEEKEEEEEYKESSRWWFASTACPLLAGTFGPIANGFSICALVNEWRVYIPPEGTEEHGIKIMDPPWLLAVNAISLACALVGNGSLLLNMSRRLKFTIAQPITIVGFLLAGILLIVDMAVITSSPTYFLTGKNAPDAHHALTSAYYYAIFAAVFYIIIGSLMGLTVYGALKGYYERDFRLTPSQRTLMLQTMSFMAYLLLGALVFSKVEGWNYLDAVYWADVTLLTVGLGDYSPSTNVGRGLLFPFALGGILIVGLVIGSIRSLVLERGKEKLSARITEKHRSKAVHNVDERKQTVRISWFAAADFSTEPALSPAQRREEEFNVMRKVQATAENERRWAALGTSSLFALILWFVGAAIFMVCEKNQEWTYFQSLYFAYVCLLTIGYGDYEPMSNSGRAFFVVWSILAVPSLTILISDMGDTVVKWVSDLTVLVGSITVLPGEQGFRAGTKSVLQNMLANIKESLQNFTPPGLLGDRPGGHGIKHEKRIDSSEHERHMMDRVADRLTSHVEKEELQEAKQAERQGDDLEADIHFYHYVLARECRNVQKDLSATPPKQYTWQDWEYFLKLMGNEDDPKDYPGQKQPDILVPEALRMAPSSGSAGSDQTMTDGAVDRETEMKEWKQAHEKHKKFRPHPDRKNKRQLTTMDVLDWSWLSDKSPLMGSRSEPEWILERLSAALERELNRQRKGFKRQPPISMSEVRRRKASADRKDQEDPIANKEAHELDKAAKSKP